MGARHHRSLVVPALATVLAVLWLVLPASAAVGSLSSLLTPCLVHGHLAQANETAPGNDGGWDLVLASEAPSQRVDCSCAAAAGTVVVPAMVDRGAPRLLPAWQEGAPAHERQIDRAVLAQAPKTSPPAH